MDYTPFEHDARGAFFMGLLMITYGSLFSGIGGIDLGFDRAGLRCVWQVEIDEYARRVLQKHWPEVPKHDDIKTFRDAPYVDVIAGGFPCQDISYAGKGAGLQGERSGLFYEAMRVVGEVGPRIVVLENVSALLTRGMDEVLGSLASLAAEHDYDKLTEIDWFYSDFRTKFEQTGWWDNHRKIHRHHLGQADGVPENVNLLDVLEYIADCVMAGMARSGEVYALEMPDELLQKAFVNTVCLLKDHVKVVS